MSVGQDFWNAYVVVSLNTGACCYTVSKYVLYVAIAAALVLALVLGSFGLVFTSRRRASRYSVCGYNWGTRTWRASTPSEQQRILQFYMSMASTRSQWTFVGANIGHPSSAMPPLMSLQALYAQNSWIFPAN